MLTKILFQNSLYRKLMQLLNNVRGNGIGSDSRMQYFYLMALVSTLSDDGYLLYDCLADALRDYKGQAI